MDIRTFLGDASEKELAAITHPTHPQSVLRLIWNRTKSAVKVQRRPLDATAKDWRTYTITHSPALSAEGKCSSSPRCMA